MAALDYLRGAGLAVEAKVRRIVVSPVSRLANGIRLYVKTRCLELLAELAANEELSDHTAQYHPYWFSCYVATLGQTSKNSS